MANIFITYGDDKYKKSLELIKKEAQSVGIFNQIIVYTPHDLPNCIKSSPLFLFRKGGGYWVWKPYIIYDALLHCQENDVIYYTDAGCTLNPKSSEWHFFQKEMHKHNAIFFQYRSDVQYEGWSNYCSVESNNSPQIIHWMKPSAIDYFTDFTGNQDFLQYNKIWGGAIIIKKTSPLLNILDQWLKITIFYPELVCDPYGKELSHIPATFNEHRHDQSILTPLIYKYRKEDCALVLPETSESDKQHAAIIASRRIAWTWNLFDKLLYRLRMLKK